MEPINLFILIYAVAALGLAWTESKLRKIHFLAALGIFILLTPLVGYFIVSNRPLKSARGCLWCGNEQNEAEYCGVCGKNEAGELNPA